MKAESRSNALYLLPVQCYHRMRSAGPDYPQSLPCSHLPLDDQLHMERYSVHHLV